MKGVLVGHQIGFPSLVWPGFSMCKVPFCLGGQSTRVWEDVVRGRQQAWRWIRTGTGTRQLLTEPHHQEQPVCPRDSGRQSDPERHSDL